MSASIPRSLNTTVDAIICAQSPFPHNWAMRQFPYGADPGYNKQN